MRSRRVIAAASVRVRGAIVQVVLAQVAVLDLQGGVVDAELVVEVVHQRRDEQDKRLKFSKHSANKFPVKHKRVNSLANINNMVKVVVRHFTILTATLQHKV